MAVFEIIMCIALLVFLLGMALLPLFMMFSDSATFNAIDEKIAEMIRGKEE